MMSSIMHDLRYALRQFRKAPGFAITVVSNSYLPLLDRLRAIPGVRVAALSSVLPLRSGHHRPPGPGASKHSVRAAAVDPILALRSE